jgi:hypothetical protein
VEATIITTIHRTFRPVVDVVGEEEEEEVVDAVVAEEEGAGIFEVEGEGEGITRSMIMRWISLFRGGINLSQDRDLVRLPISFHFLLPIPDI